MAEPNFPVPLEIMRGKIAFEDFSAGDSFDLYPGVKVKTTPLNHPNGATGYRIEHKGASICYVTDTEHVIGKPDQRILGLIDGADLLIYDSTYSDKEFPSKINWGHSTWQEAVRLCKSAGVKKLVVFHHDPDHDDDRLDAIGREVEAALPGAVMAREGMVLTP